MLCLVSVGVLLRGCGSRITTRPTPQLDADARFWIRVRLSNNITDCTIELPSAFQIASANSDSDAPVGGLVQSPLVEPTRISFVEGQLRLGSTPLPGQQVVFIPEAPCIFGLNGQKYRGKLKLIVSRDGQSFDAINLVPLEPYLAGVVGAEMPDYWEPEALQAQTIASRTYCLFIKKRFGVNRHYDVTRTQSSQVYGGLGAESAQVWDAVNRTCGQVLLAPEPTSERAAVAASTRGTNPSWSGLFPAYFSSSCGGHTSSGEEVFGDSFGPLQGVPCPYCRDVAKLEMFYWQPVEFDRATVTQRLMDRYPKLAALGEIAAITATEESCYGEYSRLWRIRLTGTTGKTDTLRAEDLRLALDPSGRKIKSAICRIVSWGNGWAFIAGRGWGHGVGLCQCGAEGMARLGSDARSILQYYYPGAQIGSLY